MQKVEKLEKLEVEKKWRNYKKYKKEEVKMQEVKGGAWHEGNEGSGRSKRNSGSE